MVFEISRQGPAPLLFRTSPADIHSLSEDPPEDPIQEIFTRNLGIFAAGVFSFDRVSRMMGWFLTSRRISAKYSPHLADH